MYGVEEEAKEEKREKRENGAKVMSFDLLWPYHSLILSYQPMGAMGGPSVQYQGTLKFASVEYLALV